MQRAYRGPSRRGSCNIRHAHSSPAFCVMVGARDCTPAMNSSAAPTHIIPVPFSSSRQRAAKSSWRGAPRARKQSLAPEARILSTARSASSEYGSKFWLGAKHPAIRKLLKRSDKRLALVASVRSFEPRRNTGSRFLPASWQIGSTKSAPVVRSIGIPSSQLKTTIGKPSAVTNRARR